MSPSRLKTEGPNTPQEYTAPSTNELERGRESKINGSFLLRSTVSFGLESVQCCAINYRFLVSEHMAKAYYLRLGFQC